MKECKECHRQENKLRRGMCLTCYRRITGLSLSTKCSRIAELRRKENIDTCEGEEFPVNSKLQGESFQKFSPLMNKMRTHQLIKSIKYKIEIEYFPEVVE